MQIAIAELVLALGGLFHGTAELAAMELLPSIAESSEVGVPAAATGYVGAAFPLAGLLMLAIALKPQRKD